MPISLSGFPQQLLALTVTSSTQQQTPNAHHEYVGFFIYSFPAVDLTVFPKGQEDIPDPAQSNGMSLVLVFSALYLIDHAIGLNIVEPAKDDPAEEGGEDSESLFGGTSSSLPVSFPALYLIVPAIHI